MLAFTGQGRPETIPIPVMWTQRSKDTIPIAILTLVLLAGAVGAWMRTGGGARRRLAALSGGVYTGLGLTAALSGGGASRPSHG